MRAGFYLFQVKGIQVDFIGSINKIIKRLYVFINSIAGVPHIYAIVFDGIGPSRNIITCSLQNIELFVRSTGA